MPKAMYAIWWDDNLGPFVGRTWPEEKSLTGEEALTIFMGHGVNMEAKIGYTKIPAGLVVSFMEAPNCIAVLLEEDDEPSIIERNLLRIVPTIDFSSSSWDDEIKKAYFGLKETIRETTGDKLLTNPGVKKLIQDMFEGRLDTIKPQHVLSTIDKYPEAKEYFGADHAEVIRTLKDLEDAGVIIPKTYGRRIECRQCGSSEVKVTLQCPSCNSEELYKVYTVFCPLCSEQFQTVLVDDITEIQCLKCQQAVKVAGLSVLEVEPLCNSCGTASENPKVVLTCSTCDKQLKGADLLAGTGLAYVPYKSKDGKNS
ncbi:MAG: hypothetical protein P1Q69_12240 [Candidatus Thorarchaeota archaeon]|nr:hypothetical protein [Candidatus Thorarchaeota archaeon]